jgi:diketogulonate reductase-like aldo/keto reductase
LERATKASLARLRLSEVDLLLVHWPNPRIPLAETIGALCRMKRTGLTRYIGVSNFTVPLLEAAVREASEPLVVNQIEWHPFLDQSKMRAACAAHGMAITAYCPLARGRIIGNEVLVGIGKAHAKSVAQVSLRYLVQEGAIGIPRTAKVERLSENLAIFDFALSNDEMNAIRALGGPHGRLVNWPGAPTWD